ncbi:hypothetical protein Vadar_012628 [Vaccinium darrowii]|uniref:Uncharacterized protein n=1 Tax=Vaccinium darrowii TaxID=229202 RepID=A0ACB7ZC55_9ERIC|nr:hypothetical protein Vadar_012628 [Vaccinium darrowii]
MAVVSRIPFIPHGISPMRHNGIGMMASPTEIVEEPPPQPPPVHAFEDKMYIAVGTDVRESKSVVTWALRNSGGRKICILHVHEPAQWISMMGTKFPVSQLEEHHVRAFRQGEKQEMDKLLRNYCTMCSSARVGEVAEELHIAGEPKSSLESQIGNSNEMVKDLEQKMFSAVALLQRYKKERDELQAERDNALKEAEELKKEQAEASANTLAPEFFCEFSFSEIEEATSSFDLSLRIGEGGYGNIYKGLLRHTEVAIKMLRSNSEQGPSEFQQELLTGRSAVGIKKEVEYALDKGNLKNLLDATAGDWPFVQAQKLAHIAMRCCEMNRRSRPDLASDVWRVLARMRVSCGAPPFLMNSEEDCQIPPYFMSYFPGKNGRSTCSS